MNQRQQYTFGVKSSPMGTIGAILTFGLILFGIYYLIKGAYFVLGIIAPILLIATLIIDYKVVTGYIKSIYTNLKKNPLLGIGMIILTVLASPLVAGYLFAKAWMKRSIKKFMGEVPNPNVPNDKGYTEYEEVVEEDEQDFLILPEVEQPKPVKKDDNKYDDLFE